MASKNLYRVVEVTWKGGVRVEDDFGTTWKPEKEAKKDLKEMQRKHTSRLFSIQKHE